MQGITLNNVFVSQISNSKDLPLPLESVSTKVVAIAIVIILGLIASIFVGLKFLRKPAEQTGLQPVPPLDGNKPGDNPTLPNKTPAPRPELPKPIKPSLPQDFEKNRQLYLESIKINPEDSSAYYKLAELLHKGNKPSATLKDGTPMTVEQLLRRSIALDPNAGAPYFLLYKLGLDDGKEHLSKRQLIEKSLNLGFRSAEAYCELAMKLSPLETVQLKDEPILNQHELFVRSIKCDSQYAPAYYHLGTHLQTPTIDLQVPEPKSMNRVDLIKRSLELDPHNAHGNNAHAYNRLALALGSTGGSITLFEKTPFERTMKQQELTDECNKICATTKQPSDSREKYLNKLDPKQRNTIEAAFQSIALKLNDARAYYELAINIPSGGSIDLWDGTPQNETELLQKAIQLDPNFAEAYEKLGGILASGKSISIDGQKQMTREQLLLKSIEINPKSAPAYFYLGEKLADDATIVLGNTGKSMTKKALFQESIRLDPKHGQTYYFLGMTLKKGEKIPVNGHDMDQKDLFKECLVKEKILDKDKDPEYGPVYFKLGELFQSKETVSLSNMVMTKRDLLVKSLSYDSKNEKCYQILGTLISSPHEYIELEGGKKKMFQQDLYKESIHINPQFARAYNDLANTLPDGGSIRLTDGTLRTKRNSIKSVLN